MNNVDSYIASVKSRVDFYLEQFYSQHKERIPERLYEVLNYAIFPGGKMLRPAIVFAFCEEMGSDPARALPVASAIEMIHTFSLVHDDLPCMDNDDYRRGRETVHKRYSEALALLCGDALLADAFMLISEAQTLSDQEKSKIVYLISRYAGSMGMIGGQVVDIEYNKLRDRIDPFDLIRLKTANMFILSSLCGAICSGREYTESRVVEFGEDFGILFQLTDDVLDLTQDKKGSFNMVEIFGFNGVVREIEDRYRRLSSFIEESSFKLGIISGIVELVIRRIEGVKNISV